MTYEADERGYRVKSTAAVNDETDTAPVGLGFQSEPVVTSQQELKPDAGITQLLADVPLKTVGPVVDDRSQAATNRPMRFKEAKTDLSSAFSYNLGYPFVPGNYIYAL